jgi:Transglutaminase-like superfamily
MKKESILGAASFAINVLLIASILLSLYGLAWEYSTRWYLSGFANAVLPYSSTPEQKVTAILNWMAQGPAREADYYSDDAENRDPVDTLNYTELLNVCGTATNAFVNLASAGGLDARRLLLLDAQGRSTTHVVAEVQVDGRWIIVDPAFHAVLRDRTGRPLTRQELARPEIFQEATQKLRNYDPAYSYQHTAFIHFARLPVVGQFLQAESDSLLPGWQESINWTVLVERQSYSTFVVGIALLFLAVFLRRALSWCARRFAILPLGAWEQLKRGSVALFSPAFVAAGPHGNLRIK